MVIKQGTNKDLNLKYKCLFIPCFFSSKTLFYIPLNKHPKKKFIMVEKQGNNKDLAILVEGNFSIFHDNNYNMFFSIVYINIILPIITGNR